MDQYIRLFGNCSRIGVVIGIRNDFWEGSKEMAEAMMKFSLTILEIILLSIIRVFSP